MCNFVVFVYSFVWAIIRVQWISITTTMFSYICTAHAYLDPGALYVYLWGFNSLVPRPLPTREGPGDEARGLIALYVSRHDPIIYVIGNNKPTISTFTFCQDKSAYFSRQGREDAEVVCDCVRAGPRGGADPYSARLLRDVLRFWRGGATCGRRDSFWKMWV